MNGKHTTCHISFSVQYKLYLPQHLSESGLLYLTLLGQRVHIVLVLQGPGSIKEILTNQDIWVERRLSMSQACSDGIDNSVDQLLLTFSINHELLLAPLLA